MYIYICTYIYTYTYIHIYKHTYIYTSWAPPMRASYICRALFTTRFTTSFTAAEHTCMHTSWAPPMRASRCLGLRHFNIHMSSANSTAKIASSRTQRQYLYFCTSKASKVSTSRRTRRLHAVSTSLPICNGIGLQVLTLLALLVQKYKYLTAVRTSPSTCNVVDVYIRICMHMYIGLKLLVYVPLSY